MRRGPGRGRRPRPRRLAPLGRAPIPYTLAGAASPAVPLAEYLAGEAAWYAARDTPEAALVAAVLRRLATLAAGDAPA